MTDKMLLLLALVLPILIGGGLIVLMLWILGIGKKDDFWKRAKERQDRIDKDIADLKVRIDKLNDDIEKQKAEQAEWFAT